MHEPHEAAAQHARLTEAHGRRFLMGIGVSHAPLIDLAEAGRYTKPLSAMRAFLDGLDAAPTPVAVEDRVLAALGPKMLGPRRHAHGGDAPVPRDPRAHRGRPRRARSREARRAGAGRGPGVRSGHGPGHRPIAPGRVPRPARTTRTTGSASASPTTTSPTAAATAWSTRSWPGAARTAIVDRVQAHRDAGADHVCVQVLTANLWELPLAEWRLLAPALTS